VRRWLIVALLLGGGGTMGAFLGAQALAGTATKGGKAARVASARHALLLAAATGRLKPARIQAHILRNGAATTTTKILPAISGGTIVSAQDAVCPGDLVPNCDERAQGADAGPSGNIGLDSGASPQTLGCDRRELGNERVNQDCTYRRQAEEDITYNINNPNNLVAGQNDSRVGFNQCGIDFSTNNGSAWGDMLPPFRQHLNDPQSDTAAANGTPNQNTLADDPGTFHTYDAASDPVNATDSHSRAFFSCVVFDIADNASGVFVTESPTGAEGSFYYNVPELGSTFMPVEDNNPVILYDKEWIAADHYAHSPNRDNVYVTFTVFKFGPNCAGATPTSPGQCESPIFGSMSTDHGHTWSTPEEISGSSDALCSGSTAVDPNAPAHACNLDQGSSPVVLPNGDLEVVFNNGNTGAGNVNGQQLGVHCHPTGSSPSGTAHFNCPTPAKVGDDIAQGEPLCDFGRGPEQCVPGPYIRSNDFPRILTENTQNNRLDVVWQDYRHGEYDIHMSQSSNGGLTWSDAGQVNPDSGLDHYFPAVDQSPSHGDRLGVSYYRSQRVPGENTTPAAGFAPCSNAAAANMGSSTDCQPGVGNENSDYVLAGGTGDQTPYAFKVISPVFPPPDGIQSGFNGDYSGITINKGEEAHPIWSDTRNVNPYPANGVTHDEDVFTDNVGLPNGHAKPQTGMIGHS
jgi:hypothetical protein